MPALTLPVMPPVGDILFHRSPSPSSSVSSGESSLSQSSYDSQSSVSSYEPDEAYVESDSVARSTLQRTVHKSHSWTSYSIDDHCTYHNSSKPARQQPPHAQFHEYQNLRREFLHPRRTSTVATHPPPTLVRNSDRKDQFVNNLVDSATCMVEVIWPLASCDRHNLSLRTYIQEILKRTKTSFSTLQVALFYLLLIKAHIPMLDFTKEQPRDMATVRGFQCGRRMFLAAIILASKYLQDRNYSSKAWSKITSLPVEEINANEMAFLRAVDWKLHIPESKFDRWQSILIKYSQPSFVGRWKEAVRVLRPELDNLPPLSLAPKCIRIDTAVPRATSYPSPMPISPSPIVCISSTSPSSHHHSKMVASPAASIDFSPIARMPSAPRMGTLATPQFNDNMAPICQTPAAGFVNAKSSAMRGAMSLVQTIAKARSVQDYGTAPHSFCTVGGLAPPTMVSPSSASSPESMLSDNSSLASRSSSISSASSYGNCSADMSGIQKLQVAQMNALKEANMVTHTQIAASPEDIVVECLPSPIEHEHPTRKRGRGSLDFTVNASQDSVLQQEVSRLVPVASIAQTFDAPRRTVFYPKGVTCHARHLSSGSLDAFPAAKRLRAQEYAADIWRPKGGPGMWKHIL